MDDNELRDMQAQTVDEIVEQLPALSADELRDLRAIEAAESNRKGVLSAIDAEAKHRASAGEAGDAAESAPPAAKPEAWRAEEYTGPLTADQAAWRHRHTKPVGVIRTK